MRLQVSALLAVGLLWSGLPGRAQEVAHTATPTVIRTETRLVLVDAVVTDKKGAYLPDLSQKDFKVFEDNKEQPITSFSYEADPASPNNNQKRYLVLFFDNASVSMGDQLKARDAATKFVDSNTGPNKFIAVVNFSGTLKVAQNFTNDPDRLKAAISGAKSSAVNTDDGSTSIGASGLPSLSAASRFGVSSVLASMRSLAKNLSDVPGRKMLVMLTAGFVLPQDSQSELTATIAACNKSNVSIYPVDVRGLTAPGMMPASNNPMGGRGGIIHEDPLPPMARVNAPAPSNGLFRLASFSNSFLAPDQARGGAGAGAGSTGAGAGAGAAPGGSAGSAPGAGAGGARTGTSGATTSAPSPGNVGNNGNNGNNGGNVGRGAPGATMPGGVNGNRGNNGLNTGFPGRGGGVTPPINPALTNPNLNNARNIMGLPNNMDMNRDALMALAQGTGGFLISNTNDLLGGMEKIAREQNQFYIIGFTPMNSNEGSCHSLRVKVDKGGSNVRSRSGYCNVHSVDMLAGKPAETELESIAVGQSKGNLGSPLQLPFFYTGPNVARVNAVLEVPTAGFKFEKVKGKLHSEMNVLGIAYKPDGSVAAKFSDALKFDFEQKSQADDFMKKPLHYESQFEIATGTYNVKVVFSAGAENFGKVEKPLSIEPFDGKGFAVSSLALGQDVPAGNDSGLDAVLIEDHVPMVAVGVQVIPAAEYRFKQTDSPHVYLEIFEPGETTDTPPKVMFSIQVTDKKDNSSKMAAQNVALDKYVRKGNPVVPVVLTLPVKDLAPGSYKLDILGLNSVGKGMLRTVDFEIEPTTGRVSGWDKK